MSQHDELKRAAEAVKKAYADLCEHGGDDLAEAWNSAEIAYDDAANPEVILGLIAENEQLQDHKQYLIDLREAHGLDCWSAALVKLDQLRAEIAGLKTGYQAYEQVNAELKAENEALRDGANFRAIQSLRQDCVVLRKALGECADSLHGEMLQKFGGQLLDDMHPVTRRDYDRDMAELAGYRAAMGQGEQS